jgi:hypothetical protein
MTNAICGIDFKRRSATRDTLKFANRGLKPTATVLRSLCDQTTRRTAMVRASGQNGGAAALDTQVRLEGENPSIGIILCKEKSRTMVEYALHDARKPIGVATYHTVKRLPKELKGQLPAPEQIIKLLEDAP